MTSSSLQDKIFSSIFRKIGVLHLEDWGPIYHTTQAKKLFKGKPNINFIA
jgi:hypothetical protein